MGLGDLGPFNDGDGGGGGGGMAAAVWCSICLDAVTDNGDRSWAKLQCGHQFHLGSAFNVKGTMQCPNCRKIEKGQWLYATGSRSLPDFSMDDWAHEDDLYDLSYSEMSFGVHWCPFSALTGLPSSFDEGEFQSSSYHDLGHHAIFAEHNPVSSTTHPCPYIAYLGPVHPSSSTPSGNVPDGSSFSNQWNSPSVPSEVSYGFPSMDAHYHSWDHSPPFAGNNRMGNADQLPIPSMTQRAAWNTSDVPRHGMHPFIIGHSSSGRALGSLASSALPPYPSGVARPRDRSPSLQAYLQQPNSGSMGRSSHISSGRRSSSRRGLAQVASMASSTDPSNSVFFFPPPSSSGRTYQESENPPIHDRFIVWEREQQPAAFPLSQVDRDSIWGPFHPPTGGSLGFQQRHGSERMPSQNRS